MTFGCVEGSIADYQFSLFDKVWFYQRSQKHSFSRTALESGIEVKLCTKAGLNNIFKVLSWSRPSIRKHLNAWDKIFILLYELNLLICQPTCTWVCEEIKCEIICWHSEGIAINWSFICFKKYALFLLVAIFFLTKLAILWKVLLNLSNFFNRPWVYVFL